MVGFVETGKRATESDGNPSPPPLGHPGTPLLEQVVQAPYDVSNTDYFRDLRPIVTNPIVEVPSKRLNRSRTRLSTLVVADTAAVKARALKRFAERGGNLVLTDGALQLLPRLTGIPADAVRMRTAYVGYSDLDRSHPWTKDLYLQARQMFDPVGLGYPLLMERDQYWPCSTTCDESGTENSAPVWTADRAAWEKSGGVTIATADPLGGKAQGEGTNTDRTAIGTLPLGRGRIVVFGALLPQPTESYDHWFGVNAYTVSIPGQQLLLEALHWTASASPGVRKARRCTRRSVTFHLPARRGKRLRLARVYVNGKRVRVVRGRRLRAPVRLRRVPRRAFTVRIRAVTRSGRRVTAKRHYPACARRPAHVGG
jgi:hypothetical protein